MLVAMHASSTTDDQGRETKLAMLGFGSQGCLADPRNGPRPSQTKVFWVKSPFAWAQSPLFCGSLWISIVVDAPWMDSFRCLARSARGWWVTLTRSWTGKRAFVSRQPSGCEIRYPSRQRPRHPSSTPILAPTLPSILDLGQTDDPPSITHSIFLVQLNHSHRPSISLGSHGHSQ